MGKKYSDQLEKALVGKRRDESITGLTPLATLVSVRNLQRPQGRSSFN